jgi:hypothetical protein
LLALDEEKWPPVVNKVMKIQFTQNAENLTSYGTTRFSRRFMELVRLKGCTI